MPTPTDFTLTTNDAEPIAFPAITGNGATAIPPVSSTPTTNPAVPVNFGGGPAALPNMPASFVPAFNGLTGGGPSLATLTANAADVTAGRIIQGTVAGEFKSYQVRAGDDAQVLPGIVRPANFDAEENPVVFVSI